MSDQSLISLIEEAWIRHTAEKNLSPLTQGPVREAVEHVIAELDAGHWRIAEKIDGQWQTHHWMKKALLLSFPLNGAVLVSNPAGPESWDKVPSKVAGWGEEQFKQAGFRMSAGAIVRRSAYVAPEAVLLPSFVNMGARVGRRSMIDAWATVGSCAQIGDGCHISGGAGIGGAFEPEQANVVVIEDNCFIGARSEVVEGVVVEEGSRLSMGVFIGASTKIVDRATGNIFIGRVPANSVVVPGMMPGESLPNGNPGPSTACVVIVKTVDKKTLSKTSLNSHLRDAHPS